MLKQLDILVGLAVVFTIASLLVTMLTQFIASVLALRGKNFVSALSLALQKVAPDVEKTALDALAKHIAKDPWLTDSSLAGSNIAKKVSEAYRYCSAARSNEVMQILKEIAESDGLKILSDKGEAATDIYKTAKECYAALIKAAVPASLEKSKQGADQLSADTKESLPAATEANSKQTAEVQTAMADMTAKFENVFNIAMERASQRFAYHTRFWNTVLALFVVVLLQIDTLALIRQLRTDEVFRKELGGLASQVLSKTDAVLKDGTVPAAVVKEALLKKPDTEVSPEKKAALKAMNLEGVNGVPGEVAKAGLSRQWLQETTRLYGESFATTMNLLDNGSMGLEIKDWDAWWQWWTTSHLLGVTTAWLLVCLGSPFWFNILRSLASLRPQLAGKVDEKKSA